MSQHRYRVAFSKTLDLRFIGHLDLHRAWERTCRRAGLPLAYSQGYNPRPRINIALALPLGCTSQGDLMDIYLEQEWDANPLLSALQKAAPPGLVVEGVEPVTPSGPALQQCLSATEYRVTVGDGGGPAELQSRVEALLARDSLPRQRRGKTYDLRPLIQRLELEPGGTGNPPTLRMQLSAREGATGRPDEVLDAMGLDPLPLIPHRTRLILQDEPS